MELACLWIGDSLGDIEIASAKSFLNQGDSLTLYSYSPVSNVPEGVRQEDANLILRSESIIRHKKTGSPALHSDLFRFALIQKTGAIWVDLDILALRPFNFPTQWVFGYESSDIVNGAVLHFPSNSETLKELLKYDAGYRGVPFHAMKRSRRLRYQLRSILKGGLTVDLWPWGSLGPLAITHFLNRTGEIKHAYPVDAFYSIPLAEVERFVKPGALSDQDIPEGAWAIHLWGKELRQLINDKYRGEVPEDSFLAKYL